jgi:hypothetical protein
LQMPGYDPVSGLVTAGNFALAVGNPNDSTLRQFYNYDIWSNPGFMKGIVVPITPQPPSATPLYSLVCTSCPAGASFTIVTV